MKFLLPLPLLCLFCLSAAAQAEFAPIGARWFQNAGINNDLLIHPLQDFYVIESEKDTLVDGLVHRKVGDFLFYQDSTKVYYRWQDSLRLIYDYGVAVGDTVRFEMFEWPGEDDIFENTLVVDNISYVPAGMDSLKRIACRIVEGQGALYTQYYTYLERMGSIRTLVEDLTYAVPLNYVPQWLRCYQDGEISYQTERFLMTAEEGQGCDFRVQTLPHFDIGTKWTYEEARSWPPIIQRPKAYEITGQTIWQDTLVYVIEPGVYGALEYMYVHGDSIYFWDWRSEVFQLNYDFSAPQSYEAIWSSYSFDVGPNTAQITVDSVQQEMIFDHVLEVQYLTAQGEQLAPLSARVFEGIGNDYGLKFGLGEDVDTPWHIDKLRCFEDGENVYRFVDYPCDSMLSVSTDEVLEEENEMRVYPNPSSGNVTIEHDRQHEDFPYRVFDLSGKLVQAGTTQGSQLEIQQAGKYILVIDDDGVYRPYRVTVVR